MNDKSFFFFNNKLIISALLIPLLLIAGHVVFAASDDQGEEKGGETTFILHHIKDAHEWHLFSIGHTHVTLPLPVILYEKGHGLRVYMSSQFTGEEHEGVSVDGYFINEEGQVENSDKNLVFYDISTTKNVTQIIFSSFLMLLIFLTIAKKYKKDPYRAPKGIQSFFEPIILFVRNEIAIPNIGEEKYQKFMPYLLTVFFFILFNNLMGLIPGAANVTGNIAVTMTLAIITFIITNINGTKTYWKNIYNMPGVPWWLKFPLPIMPLVEFISLFTKPFSLMVRLFANITAGHIIILSLIALIFIFKSLAIGPVSVAFGIFMNVIELLVAFIQAFVFTLLSAIYFGLALEEHHDDEHAEIPTF